MSANDTDNANSIPKDSMTRDMPCSISESHDSTSAIYTSLRTEAFRRVSGRTYSLCSEAPPSGVSVDMPGFGYSSEPEGWLFVVSLSVGVSVALGEGDSDSVVLDDDGSGTVVVDPRL